MIYLFYENLNKYNTKKINSQRSSSDFGNCENCKQPNTFYAWCQTCDPEKNDQQGCSSGDSRIDKCIKDFQCKATMHSEVIEWIPFDRLEKVKKIGVGGFGTVFSATWLDGIRTTKYEHGKYVNCRSKSTKVALKTLSNSRNFRENSPDFFLKEFKNHMECRLEGSNLEIYGLTRNLNNNEHLDIKAGEYLMVFQFANHGNLCKYLKKYFTKLTWKDKLLQLMEISSDLAKIHKAGYTHCDFHSGNILQDHSTSYISDLGLSKKIECISTNEIFGVMPYVAPEVLLGKGYTSAADIYGLGIIMTEMSTGQRPFDGYPFDVKLATMICKGLRPEFAPGTPDCYVELAKSCMDQDPQKRPTANDVVLNLFHQYKYIKGYNNQDKLCIKNKYLAADKIIKTLVIKPQIHPESNYTSKSINISRIASKVKSTK
ncbi:kinase-like domain-containing protein [Gigaspora rosea]|uniref:Kinase-like domain-containing protein n=1 Tax=Gigaspora rosea TaxID=44941 RepID=A0A397UE20_9GLOM|nr:kinase-like domain-containing protein [Gigaspora rosea]